MQNSFEVELIYARDRFNVSFDFRNARVRRRSKRFENLIDFLTEDIKTLSLVSKSSVLILWFASKVSLASRLILSRCSMASSNTPEVYPLSTFRCSQSPSKLARRRAFPSAAASVHVFGPEEGACWVLFREEHDAQSYEQVC